MEMVSDRRGWQDTNRYELDDWSHSFGTNQYFLCIFPAVRLACIAAGLQHGLDDPANQFMKDRIQVHKLLSEHEHRRVFRPDYPIDRTLQQKTLNAFETQLESTPFDERLWLLSGDLSIRMGNLDNAEKLLQRCLSLTSCNQEVKADAYCDLACVYARQNREDECRQMLQTSLQIRPLNPVFRDWLIHDPDLERVREKGWFQEIIGDYE
jgi:tetratricopeptide (TPR) repeat protein